MPCAGDCCVAFPLSSPLSNLWVNQGVEDGLDILMMIVPLTLEEAANRRARFGVDQAIVDDGGPYYRCIHWDETTRLCTNYDNRPAMCRYYPYGHPCEHGCGCEQGRPPLVWEGDYA
jgi:Fe-S-cluster containining protein